MSCSRGRNLEVCPRMKCSSPWSHPRTGEYKCKFLNPPWMQGGKHCPGLSQQHSLGWVGALPWYGSSLGSNGMALPGLSAWKSLGSCFSLKAPGAFRQELQYWGWVWGVGLFCYFRFFWVFLALHCSPVQILILWACRLPQQLILKNTAGHGNLTWSCSRGTAGAGTELLGALCPSEILKSHFEGGVSK